MHCRYEQSGTKTYTIGVRKADGISGLLDGHTKEQVTVQDTERLGNSVAVPCVDFILCGIAMYLSKMGEGGRGMYIYPDSLKAKATMWLWG